MASDYVSKNNAKAYVIHVLIMIIYSQHFETCNPITECCVWWWSNWSSR